MTKIKITDVVLLLDASGSMGRCLSDTIGGYNAYIESIKNTFSVVTTITFNNTSKIITNRKDVRKVLPLTIKEYMPSGNTALLDALGDAIKRFDKVDDVIFVIATDGEENSSRRYNKSKIKELISSHPKWEFIYVGANIDSFKEAESFGIRRDNISNYKQTSKGINTMFEAVADATCKYAKFGKVDSTWKKKLDNYITENKD